VVNTIPLSYHRETLAKFPGEETEFFGRLERSGAEDVPRLATLPSFRRGQVFARTVSNASKSASVGRSARRLERRQASGEIIPIGMAWRTRSFTTAMKLNW
jgi:hypothetical protein